MAQDRNDDQKSRGEDLEKNGPKVDLVERSKRMRMAECAAKGGWWKNGACYQNPPQEGGSQ